MQIVRTIVWVLLLAGLLIFAAFNWKPVEVKIWEGLVLETKIPALVIISFLLGLVPMWLLNKTQRFYMNRRISSLESAARSAATTPVVTTTDLPDDRAVVTDDAPTPLQQEATASEPMSDADRPRGSLTSE